MSDCLDSVDDAALSALISSIEAEQRALDARRLEVLAVWDRRQVWAADGSVTAAGHLARQARLDRRTARARVQVAAKLARMPHVRAALCELGWPKARLLASACDARTGDAFAVAEARLVAKALELTVDQLAVVLLHWRRMVDADGVLGDADSLHEGEYLRIDTSWGGQGFLQGRLSPESTAIVNEALAEIADELYRSRRRAGAEAALRGIEAEPMPSPSERAAEALVEMARRARHVTRAEAGEEPLVSEPLAARPGPAKPLLLVHVEVDDVGGPLARLANGAPLDPATSARLACDAAIAAVVTEGRTVPLQLGRAVRDPSDAQRRALSAIWGGCAHPTCDRPFRWCQLHHVHHWERGGPTDVANLIPLCSRHHHLHHAGVFTIERCRDGTFVFTRADGTAIGAANPAITRLHAAARELARPWITAA